MEQSKADPCVFRKIIDGHVEPALAAHVDNIIVLMGGPREACDDLHKTLVTSFATNNLGKLSCTRWLRFQASLGIRNVGGYSDCFC